MIIAVLTLTIGGGPATLWMFRPVTHPGCSALTLMEVHEAAHSDIPKCSEVDRSTRWPECRCPHRAGR
eukprot:15127697-Alexandrium_andersonii.AAC.1